MELETIVGSEKFPQEEKEFIKKLPIRVAAVDISPILKRIKCKSSKYGESYGEPTFPYEAIQLGKENSLLNFLRRMDNILYRIFLNNNPLNFIDKANHQLLIYSDFSQFKPSYKNLFKLKNGLKWRRAFKNFELELLPHLRIKELFTYTQDNYLNFIKIAQLRNYTSLYLDKNQNPLYEVVTLHYR